MKPSIPTTRGRSPSTTRDGGALRGPGVTPGCVGQLTRRWERLKQLPESSRKTASMP